ncbi:MAG: ABC transporter substrate-binding protein [Kiloniellales bacterium]
MLMWTVAFRRTSPRQLAAVAGGALMILFIAGGAVRSASSGAEEAGAFVRDLAARATTVLADPALTPAERRGEIGRLLLSKIDTQRIGRFVLGRYWNKTSPAERTEYLRLFDAYIVATYAQRLESYSGERLSVETARRLSETRAVVSSRLMRLESAPIQADWQLLRSDGDGKWRIVDVIIEGVSMALTQRSEFGAVIKASGGRIAPLLDRLQKKTAILTAAVATTPN